LKRRTVRNYNKKKKAIDERENNFCKKYIEKNEQEEPKEHFEIKIHFYENFFKNDKIFIYNTKYIHNTLKIIES